MIVDFVHRKSMQSAWDDKMATGGGGGEFNLSEECFDVNCTTCSKDNLVKQAVKYCADCKKNLCITCLQGHNKYIDGHTLVDVKDADHGSVLTEKCDKHKEEIIKFLCADHDDVLCSICAMLEHRKCHELKLITDSIDDLEKGQSLITSPKQMKSALQNVEKVITALDYHVEKLSKQEQKFLKEIEDYANKILAKIKQMKSNARKEVSIKHEQLASSAKKKRQLCAVMKEDISKSLENMKTSKERKPHMFVLMKKGQILTKKMEILSRESDKLMKENQLSLHLDKRLETCLDDVTSLASVGEKVKVKQKGEKYTATLQSSIEVSIPGDRDQSCSLAGCCILPDGTVLLVDDRNERLKHADPSTGTIKDHCDIKGVILRGVTPISPHEAVVSTLNPDLQIVSLGNKLTCKSTQQVNHNCSRLAMSQGELFVTDRDTVYVHDVKGRLLRTICKDESGQKMFPNIIGIAVNDTGDRVYVADWNYGLICVDRKGQMRFGCSDKELGLSGAYGVCTDNASNAFVCGLRSHNVVQVSEDGTVLGEILSHTQGINRPQCMCYDQDTNTLYVGDDTSTMLSFKLQ